MTLDRRLVVPKERTLFKLGVAISALCWLVLLVTVVGGPYALAIAAFIGISHALFLAHVRGNGLRVSEKQLPDLFERCRLAAGKLGLKAVPEIYVLQAGGVLNAFATKLLSRKFVIIYSNLVDGCRDPRELDFIVGHEIGHLAAGHLAWNWFLIPFHLCPWLGAAYSRAREYTCDRCGHAVVGALEPAQRALVVLAAGGGLAGAVDLAAFADQRQQTGTFWMATRELAASHPYLCKRVAALQEFSAPGTVAKVPRNPLAYPLAPLFGLAGGGAGGGVLIVVAVIGVMAAVAIPAYRRYMAQASGADASQLQMQQLLDQLNQAAPPDGSADDAEPEPEPKDDPKAAPQPKPHGP